ncbi:MAG: hypothetical protein ACM35G_03330, partial [Planctomycetaceae bacterium]
PRGWYLPQVASRAVELDSFDVVEGLVIKDGPQVEVHNGVSLHGGLVASWPMAASVTAKAVTEALVEHWRASGLPGYAQFDNDTIFQGTHARPDVVGRVMRLCLSLGVVPVFIPPRAPGFQALMAGSNGPWPAQVGAWFTHGSLADVQEPARLDVRAVRRRRADRIESAPERGPLPQAWRLILPAPPQGRVVYLRRTKASGAVALVGRSFPMDVHGIHRLGRVEFAGDTGRRRFFALRRRGAVVQPTLSGACHPILMRRFKE